MALEVGQRFVDFNLKNQDGEAVSLNDFAGQWLVVYVYPKDDTPGCTIQGKSFTASKQDFDDADISVVGVSEDDVESHKDFCSKEGLNFKLLSDSEAKVSEQYGSVMEYNGAKLSARNTFIIDPQGKVAKVFEKVKPGGHSEEVLAALASLQKQ